MIYLDIFDVFGFIKCKIFGHDLGYTFNSKCPTCAISLNDFTEDD